jgi:DNA-directed RNA polymerase specialized sigma24 family protein
MITMDYRLVELHKAGDASAVDDFVKTHQQEMFCLALSILDDSPEAEDARQESLLAALRGLESFHCALSLKTRLFSVKIAVCQLMTLSATTATSASTCS